AGALEGTPAERERLLAHAADGGGELPELGVGGEPPAELDLPPRRGAAAGAEAGAPALGLLPRLLELSRDARGRDGQRGAGARRCSSSGWPWKASRSVRPSAAAGATASAGLRRGSSLKSRQKTSSTSARKCGTSVPPSSATRASVGASASSVANALRS